jgi:hypothetical protein
VLDENFHIVKACLKFAASVRQLPNQLLGQSIDLYLDKKLLMAQAERSKGANVHFVAKIKNEHAPKQEFSWCLQIEQDKIYLAGSSEQSLSIMGRILGSNFNETLTRTEELILNYFCKNFDRAITREEFVSQIWKNSMVHPKSLNVHVSNIRKKLIGTETRIIPIGRGKWKLTQVEKGHC